MPVALLFLGANYAKIMLVFPNYTTFFFKLCSSITMANKSTNIFFYQMPFIRVSWFGNWLIQSCNGTFVVSDVPILLYSPFADIGDGLWQLWLVPACHFSERAVSFRSNRLAQLTLFCSLAYGRYWDRHGLPSDFRFLYTLVPGPISGLSKLQILLKHRTLGFKNQRACQNPKTFR